MDLQTLIYLFVGLSFALYIGIAIWSKAASTKDFYVAGGGVHPVANGMATAADWMSAASFISLAGIIAYKGSDGGAYLMGWTGGYVLLALLLAPYLRKFGKFTVPDFVGDRYYSDLARTVAVVAVIFISFTYVAGQMRGVGIVFAPDFERRLKLEGTSTLDVLLDSTAASQSFQALGYLQNIVLDFARVDFPVELKVVYPVTLFMNQELCKFLPDSLPVRVQDQLSREKTGYLYKKVILVYLRLLLHSYSAPRHAVYFILYSFTEPYIVNKNRDRPGRRNHEEHEGAYPGGLKEPGGSRGPEPGKIKRHMVHARPEL